MQSCLGVQWLWDIYVVLDSRREALVFAIKVGALDPFATIQCERLQGWMDIALHAKWRS
ncbi:MAG: hypothetical protein ABWZ39_10620 [Pseudomonas caspiana]